MNIKDIKVYEFVVQAKFFPEEGWVGRVTGKNNTWEFALPTMIDGSLNVVTAEEGTIWAAIPIITSQIDRDESHKVVFWVTSKNIPSWIRQSTHLCEKLDNAFDSWEVKYVGNKFTRFLKKLKIIK